MSSQTKPVEGAVRFRTQNPWDDPLFRSAIKGSEREQRRAEMQKAIDLSNARRVGGSYVELESDPIGEAPAVPVPAPVTTDATGTRSERWACPGCDWSSDKGSAIAGHKRSCAIHAAAKATRQPCGSRTHGSRG